MADRGWIEPIVERVLSQVMESHVVQLRAEIVRRVMEEVAAHPPEPATAAAGGAADLVHAVTEIQLGASQKEILRALLDGCGRYAARTALFVVKGSIATAWQGRGFSNAEALKDFTLDANSSSVARAIRDRLPVSAPASEFDGRFLQTFGAPSAEGRLLPLLLKDKVAALVYVDGGTEDSGAFDPAAIELLVLSTSAWLEINSLRKREVAPSPTPAQHAAAPAASSAVPAFNDPFAAHAPTHAMAAAAFSDAPAPAMTAVADAQPVVEIAPPVHQEPAEPTAPAASGGEDQEIQRKAQRFARLLVDEIKLYNQAKVAEGRKHKDLYDRLKETIEKSRSTYQKRYGNTVAASGDYFQHELVRSLAEDDISIMGANFRQ